MSAEPPTGPDPAVADDEHLKTAAERERHGDLRGAIEEYQTVAPSAPRGAEATYRRARAHLERAGGFTSPLVGAGFAAHAWLAENNEVAALRPALAACWPRRGLTGEPMPLLTGCVFLSSAVPPARERYLSDVADTVRGHPGRPSFTWQAGQDE